ncbi:MAG: UDP-glucose/GDP-mannose dehydrogenase family protein [Myxococcales bacterium]|nr:UDP-glucose/GDP-mannose dehydrogenase family protein [Polyangiaceae bacterium]MDW8249669.1 UDP-glucose/GDP-mannose dehydrogenase family protein [Myxococcales bacterium]
MKITVLGSGYVGLVAAAGFADAGHQVQCIDIDVARVEKLRRGEVPFFEPGLREVMSRAIRGGRLTFGTEINAGHRASEVYFIAVGTPPLADGSADVSAVYAAAKTIREVAEAPAVVGIKSTVPVGTCDAVQAIVDEGARVPLRVASIPEFLKEGTALADFMKPDRIILGVADGEAERVLRDLYRPLQLSSERILVMDRCSSELSKYAANAMLASRISFMNELSRLCDAIGADIHAIRRAVGSDRRIGPQFLYAGPGFGGSCFPKDVSALAYQARQAGVPLEVVEAAGRANEAQRVYVRDRALSMLGGEVAGKVVAVWGVAFKAETDDVRETPALPLIRALVEKGAEVHIHDPEAADNFVRSYGLPVRCFENEYEAATGADLLVVMTEWRHLRNPDFPRLRTLMRTPNLFDARNIWTTFELGKSGFRYLGVGTRST